VSDDDHRLFRQAGAGRTRPVSRARTGLTPAGAPAATITITVAFVSADQGLVRLSDSFGVRRTRAGSILADDGTNYQVKWDDTDAEELVPRGAGVHVATRGSLRFLALSDSRLFHAVFA